MSKKPITLNFLKKAIEVEKRKGVPNTSQFVIAIIFGLLLALDVIGLSNTFFKVIMFLFFVLMSIGVMGFINSNDAILDYKNAFLDIDPISRGDLYKAVSYHIQELESLILKDPTAVMYFIIPPVTLYTGDYFTAIASTMFIYQSLKLRKINLAYLKGALVNKDFVLGVKRAQAGRG